MYSVTSGEIGPYLRCVDAVRVMVRIMDFAILKGFIFVTTSIPRVLLNTTHDENC